MLGAVIGDIVGSTRERHNIKTEDFEMIPEGSRFTDDTVMTLAVAEWLMTDTQHCKTTLVSCMKWLGNRYFDAGYGNNFHSWLMEDSPQPYGSYGNGSAMRVSPVGLYADTMEEALDLARITAEVSHNHPEGIKGAQAVAACVFMRRHGASKAEIKGFIESRFGYNLDIRLEDIRDTYDFDVSCQGSVPIAVMAFLQRESAEDVLRLAISMGGDSDTIGCMAAAIATAAMFDNVTESSSFSNEIVEKCRALLPSDLLDICDRFEMFVSKPLRQSYHVDGKIFAGEYPGDVSRMMAQEKIKAATHFGIRHFIDLTEADELRPYDDLLPEGVSYYRFPVPDCNIPTSTEAVHQLIDSIDRLNDTDGYTYIHCWGGVGRTGTIVACYLARHMKNPSIEKVICQLNERFKDMPKSDYRTTPETKGQVEFIEAFITSCKKYKDMRDKVRGCMMAGAAGDALGYTVEFMSRNEILNRYGKDGIRVFDLDRNGKALVSDDTQMSLFTANGILMGITRGCMRGIMGKIEDYVGCAYLDWYYTQTRADIDSDEHSYTWLKYLPAMAHRRAPGCTCMDACECLLHGNKVVNNSKGCGGIMRVAPMALFAAAVNDRKARCYDVSEVAERGSEIARITHKHPLAFLPSAMLTELILKLLPLDIAEAKERIADITLETISTMKNLYPGEFEKDKKYLANLTELAVNLAANNKCDADNIRTLGEGWVGEEAWAIAIYCAIRHIDNVEEALIASVNHDGDSDSTGAVTGNIMGAIYGYEYLKSRNILCPQGKCLEDTLELHGIIIALADDLYQGCIINEYSAFDSPEKQQWYDRYYVMKPAGIK